VVLVLVHLWLASEVARMEMGLPGGEGAMVINVTPEPAGVPPAAVWRAWQSVPCKMCMNFSVGAFVPMNMWYRVVCVRKMFELLYFDIE
jgi:hypothetical protein